MPNMPHCRFENTYKDLQDCRDALEQAGGVTELEGLVNQYEYQFIRKLVYLCKEIADEYVLECKNGVE